MQCDVLVIGGGPGGTSAAMALANAGRKVLLVEKGAGLGGTCLFEGCIPSKILYESAQRLIAIRRAGEFGLRVPEGEIGVDWAAIMARKADILTRRSTDALEKAKHIPDLNVRFGSVSFEGPRQALIVPHEGTPQTVTFKDAIIATGSVPKRLPVSGMDLPLVLSSEQILSIAELPRRLAVIGAGPIGVEMAQIFAAFGSRVTLIEARSRILAPVDEEIAVALQTHIQQQGIELALDARVLQITENQGCLRVSYQNAAGAKVVADVDYVLEATGRAPNVEGLGLENTRVRFDHHAVQVDATLETAEKGIYAVGDVVGQPMFAHWATAQALALARHLLGRPIRFPTPAVNTAVIFSRPEVGIAGLTESEARAAGHAVGVERYDYGGDARAQVSGHPAGMLKLVYDTGTRAVLGLHILAEGAASLLGEGALAVEAQLSVDVLAASIHPHPTLSESIGLAARGARPMEHVMT